MTKSRNVDGTYIKGVHYSQRTEIKRGQHLAPSTEIKTGQHLGPQTEFKKGQAAHNRLPLGSVRVRVETHTGLPRAWIKIGEPNRWQKRAILVWERASGQMLPQGYVVHHKDRDTLNDDLSNLAALTRQEHADEHRGELLLARDGAL